MASSSDLEFGYRPEHAILAPIVWGARAISHDGVEIDLVWDRKSIKADDGVDKDAFYEKLNAALNVLRRAVALDPLDPGDAGKRTYTYSGITIMASTNASYGYMYLVAFPARSTDAESALPPAHVWKCPVCRETCSQKSKPISDTCAACRREAKRKLAARKTKWEAQRRSAGRTW